MTRLTDTQLDILSAASQREHRGVELPANVQGKAAGTVVKLIRAGLLEEVGSPPRSGDAMTKAERWRFALQVLASQPSVLRTRWWLRRRRTTVVGLPPAK